MSQAEAESLLKRWRATGDPDYGHRYITHLGRRGLLDLQASQEKIVRELHAHHPFYNSAAEDPQLSLIGRGSASGLELHASSRYVRPDNTFNVLLFKKDDIPLIYRLPRGWNEASREDPPNRMDTLYALPWPADLTAEARETWIRALYQSEDTPPSRDDPPLQIERLPPALQPLLRFDVAPWVLRDLHHLGQLGFPPEGLRSTFAMLDLLRRFRGLGSRELQLSEIYLHLEEVPAEHLPKLPSHLPELGPVTHERGTTVSAIAYRFEEVDGYFGAFAAQLERLVLHLHHDRWQLRVQRIWSDRAEGLALS